LTLSVAIASDVETSFQAFQKKYNKNYATEHERASRLAVFADNLVLAEQRNRDNIAAGGEVIHGVTKFSDLTPAEFKARYLSSLQVSNPSSGSSSSSGSGSDNGSTGVATIDWRTKKAVTDIENEGQCGSTWAFSIKEAIESYAFITGHSPLISLSVQQIVSCDKVDQGCNGGEPDTAYKYVMKAGGLESTEDYPYTSGNGTVAACKFQKEKVKVSIESYVMAPKGEAHLKTLVGAGPPSACLSAESWTTYTGGIMTTCPGTMDHCVQVVGYDDTNKPPYWIVRNQWSTDWGEKGYIRIAQGKDLCMLADLLSYPTFPDLGP